MNSIAELKFCPACGVGLAATSRFCPQCGCNLASYRPRAPLSPRAIGIIVVSTIAVFSVAWFSQQALTGDAPTEKFKQTEAPTTAAAAQSLDAELKKLKEEAEKNPKEKSGWVAYAQALAQRLATKDAPRDLIFEALTALRQILDIDPNDKEALLTMADISFQQQAFAKSAEFYEKYLSIMPEDLDTRARYASSLSFIGRFEDSLKELNRVLAVKPTHFHALAYSAVTYAEMGNRSKAKELGAQALANAPTAEAKERFGAFLTSLESERGNIPAPTAAPAGKAEASGSFDSSAQAVVDHVKNNPVAGRKFIEAKSGDGNSLTIYLDNFPMGQMPPFVKQKFVGGIREKAFAAGSTLKKVILFDKTNNVELEVITPG